MASFFFSLESRSVLSSSSSNIVVDTSNNNIAIYCRLDRAKINLYCTSKYDYVHYIIIFTT